MEDQYRVVQLGQDRLPERIQTVASQPQEWRTLSTRERYEAFRAQFPDIYRRANLSHTASYPGITPSTLSRSGSGEPGGNKMPISI